MHYDPPSSDGTDEVVASGRGLEGGNITLRGLGPFTNYSIQVAADSDLGRGPFSDAIIVMTAKARELLILLFGVVKCCYSHSYSIWTYSCSISQPNGDHTISIMGGACYA